MNPWRVPFIVLCFLVAPLQAQIIFRDVTEEAGLNPVLKGAFNHALAWGDWDGDGRLDLFLGNFADHWKGEEKAIPNGLFRQVQGGKFEAVKMPSLAVPGRTTGAVWVDLDNDGRLDLVVSNNSHPPSNKASRPEKLAPSILYHNRGGQLVDVTKGSGIFEENHYFTRDVIPTDFDLDGLLDLLVLEDKVFRKEAHCRLMRNLGGMKFKDVTAEVGLPTDLDGFGAAVGDVNGDGLPDFFISSGNRLFYSLSKGKYAEAPRDVFAHKPADREDFTAGATFADIDNDADLDLLVGVHHAPSVVRVFLNEGAAQGVPRFRDVTADLGIPTLPNKGATSDVGDFDNDGLVDLYWSCWFVEGEQRRPFICRGLGVKDGLPRFEVPSVRGIPINSRNVPGAGAMVYYVNGPAVDYDGDGRLDFLAGIWPDENSKLFRNHTVTSHHWLEVAVTGKRANRMGVGAKVWVRAGEKLIGYREISLAGGYSGTRPAIVHFGLGPHQTVDVEVRLPGSTQPSMIRGVKAGQILRVEEKL